MEQEQWNRNIKRLSLGIGFAIPLMLLYNVLLFIPAGGWRHGAAAKTGDMLLVIGIIVVTLALAYFCITNYTRGLKHFAANFGVGGKGALWTVRWGFVLAAVGMALQLLVFRFFNMRVAGVGQLALGNVLLVAAAVLSIIGFASLATVSDMTEDGRKGALHMTWVTLVLLLGACVESYVIQRHEVPLSWLWKALALVANLGGTAAFYLQWKRILAFPAEDSEAPAAKMPAETTETTETTQTTETAEPTQQ